MRSFPKGPVPFITQNDIQPVRHSPVALKGCQPNEWRGKTFSHQNIEQGPKSYNATHPTARLYCDRYATSNQAGNNELTALEMVELDPLYSLSISIISTPSTFKERNYDGVPTQHSGRVNPIQIQTYSSRARNQGHEIAPWLGLV